jgi:YjbE family integral membrane protein
MVIGTIVALALRLVFATIVSSLMMFPYLKIVGGIALLWIGIKLIAEDEGDGPDIKASDRMFAAIKTVIVADLVMSIDNVLAVAAAAKGSLFLLIFGLAVSIPLVIVGAQLIMKLIERMPILIVAGGGLLGFVAGEMIVEDPAIHGWVASAGKWPHWAIPIAGIVLVVGVAKWLERRHKPQPPRDLGPSP